MPVNRKYPFDELVEAQEHFKQTKRQITFEYILIKDVTCTEKAVQSLKRLLKALSAR